MNTDIDRSAGSLEDALYALAVAKPVPDAAVLDELVRQYPQHAARLTEMAVALALDSIADKVEEPIVPDVTGISEAVTDAMSRFHNRLYQVKAAERAASVKAAADPVNPFAFLNRNGLRDLGMRMGANTLFAVKLRDRLIEHKTMTNGFRQHFADKAGISLAAAIAHLSAPPAMFAAAHYKAEEKPAVGNKQTFEEAVRTSGLTAKQKAFLLGL
jgi:hypothetical protein